MQLRVRGDVESAPTRSSGAASSTTRGSSAFPSSARSALPFSPRASRARAAVAAAAPACSEALAPLPSAARAPQDAINTRWRILPADQRDGIKGYVVAKLIAISNSDESYRANKLFIGKMNKVLVQILKQEWPHNWPNFIGDICGASQTSEVLCENNMVILRLLSEDVFDFSKDAMTTAKIRTLKESLNSEFAKIFQLCELVLSSTTRASLLNQTLATLQRFLTWIPLGYIFETQLLSTLVHKFFTAPQFRNAALDCLAEIASLTDLQPQYDPLFCELYVNFMQRLVEIVPEHVDIPQAYENGSETDKNFIQKLALFFTGYFKAHLKLLETAEHAEALLSGLRYLVRISMVPDNEVFQIALEYWHQFSQELYVSETQCVAPAGLAAPPSPLLLTPTPAPGMRPPRRAPGGGAGAPRKDVFPRAGLLTQLRAVMIRRLAKPRRCSSSRTRTARSCAS